MYFPRFEITNKILRNIGVIEVCKEVIENAPLIPAYERKFKDDVLIRTVHHATHLEGNDLSIEEAKKVVEGEKIVAGDRDIQEVINYRNVLKYLDEIGFQAQKDETFLFKETHLLKIHSLVVDRVVDKAEVGSFRRSQVILKNSLTGAIIFRPPPSLEVPYYVNEMLSWLNKTGVEEIHPVLAAAVCLYLLYAIHPFTEGNGRTARGFATLVLFVRKYDIRKLFSLEEYFDSKSQEYYDSLSQVDRSAEQVLQRDLTSWLEFFTLSLTTQLQKVKEMIKRISVDDKLKNVLGGRQIALSERQIRLMEHVEEFGEIKMREAKEIVPMVSEDTLLRDLMDLIKKGILRKKGSTKKAIYLLRSRKNPKGEEE